MHDSHYLILHWLNWGGSADEGEAARRTIFLTDQASAAKYWKKNQAMMNEGAVITNPTRVLGPFTEKSGDIHTVDVEVNLGTRTDMMQK